MKSKDPLPNSSQADSSARSPDKANKKPSGLWEDAGVGGGGGGEKRGGVGGVGVGVGHKFYWQKATWLCILT